MGVIGGDEPDEQVADIAKAVGWVGDVDVYRQAAYRLIGETCQGDVG